MPDEIEPLKLAPADTLGPGTGRHVMNLQTRVLDKAALGVAGLDDILAGGLARGRVYLLEGSPGTGKTTIAMEFLLQGASKGEKGLYVTLSESNQELRDSAASHGWSLEGLIDLFELVPPESLLDAEQQQSLLYSSDLELGETTKLIFNAIERSKPSRIVLDSLSEIRLLAQSSLRYRRQILALKHYFARHGATVLMLDDLTTDTNDKTVHSVAHGVIRLEELAPNYGAERRRLRVVKYRGQKFRGGYHDFAIETGGVKVFPRLVAAEHRTRFARTRLASGIAELDGLLKGGVERGSSTLILGPAGTGKSLLTLHFAVAAVERGEKAALFIFDEEIGLLFARAKEMGIDIEALQDSGNLLVEQVDAAEKSPGEFAHRVRACVDQHEIRTVVIDSLNGYQAGHARGAGPHPAHPRIIAVPESSGRLHLSHRRPARPRRRHEGAGGRDLSCRHRHPAALFRGGGAGAARHLGRQEAGRLARGHHPRVPHRRPRHYHRPAPRRVSGRATRR